MLRLARTPQARVAHPPTPAPNPIGRAMAAALAGVAALAGLSACATAPNANPLNLSAGQVAQVGQACRTIVRLPPGEEHYEACQESLAASLNTQARAAQPALGSAGFASSPTVSTRSYFSASAAEINHRERLSCASLGFEPGGGAFTACVTSLDGALFSADMPAH